MSFEIYQFIKHGVIRSQGFILFGITYDGNILLNGK